MTPTPDHPIDDLVRDHLRREEARVDAAAVLARVKAARQPAPARRVWPWRVAVVGVGAAAAVAAGLLFAPNPQPEPEPKVAEKSPPAEPAEPIVAPATPVELVRAAMVVHSDATDRCYDLRIDRTTVPPRPPGGPVPLFLLIREGKVWTRGNAFRFEGASDGRRVVFGRDHAGRMWVAIAPRVGVIYATDEGNEPFARMCDVMSLRGPALAAELLDRYELTRADRNRGEGDTVRVEAAFRARPGEFGASHVTLDLEPRTKVIRSAVIKRLVGGEAVATFTFTLVETGRQPDDRYELAAHLEPGARIVDGKDKSLRDGLIRADLMNRFPGGKKN